jgi:DNA excision repair protein ERCC-4
MPIDKKKSKPVGSKESLILKRLEQELLEHNGFFDMLVDMIPSKLYISGNSGDDHNPSEKYFKGSKETSKEARKASAKVAKRRKLDPSSAEPTFQTNSRLEGEEPSEQTKTPPAPDAITSENKNSLTNGQSRIEALRAKLHAKIAAKSGNRPDPEGVSKRAARRAEKNRRREEAKKRKLASSKLILDNKNTPAMYQLKSATPAATPDQDLRNLDFGNISGLNASSSNYMETNKSLKNLSKSKNLQKLLADAEAKRQKLEELKKGSSEDKEKAAEIEWKDTFKEADGIRVKDNPAKLKKAIKRKAAKKSKSQKAWKSRMEQQQEAAKNRQQIRNHNIQARKQGGAIGANLSKKRIVEQDNASRQSRAGFEGRKQDFLNSPKEQVASKKSEKQKGKQ